MDKIKTGELIKNKRIEKGYTQLELGDLLSVSNKAVSRWERGIGLPDIGNIEALAEAFVRVRNKEAVSPIIKVLVKSYFGRWEK